MLKHFRRLKSGLPTEAVGSSVDKLVANSVKISEISSGIYGELRERRVLTKAIP